MRKRDIKRKLKQFLINDYDFKDLCNEYGYYTKEREIMSDFLDFAFALDIVCYVDKKYIDVSWLQLDDDGKVLVDLDYLWRDFIFYLEDENYDLINRKEVGYEIPK